jgi:hypothetical protein
MSRSENVLIGTDEPFGDVVAAFSRALGVDGQPSGGGPIFFPVTRTGGAWLDPEPADVLAVTPTEWRDALIYVEVEDKASKLDGDEAYAAQAATARRIYAALVASTPWKVVLVIDDVTEAVRERVTTAA